MKTIFLKQNFGLLTGCCFQVQVPLTKFQALYTFNLDCLIILPYKISVRIYSGHGHWPVQCKDHFKYHIEYIQDAWSLPS